MRYQPWFASLWALLALSGCTEDFGFGLIQTPYVTAIEPATGPTKGGTKVKVTGAHFLANTAIDFDGHPCLDVNIVNETTIECNTPVHDAGEARVAASHPSSGKGDKTAAFTYEAPPRFSLNPGDEVGYTKVNINYCESDFCSPATELEAAWRSSWVVSTDGVAISETTGEWEVKAHFVNMVMTAATDATQLSTSWLASFGPYDKPQSYTDEGDGTYTTSVPPIPQPSGASQSFPFFDMANWEAGAQKFRDYVETLDPDARFEDQQAARKMEAYFVDQNTPPREHHILITFHQVGIVCSFDEEITAAVEGAQRNQQDFTGVLITPKANLSFAYVLRVGGQKKFCNCAANDGCE